MASKKKKKQKKTFGAGNVIIPIVLVVALLSALGYVGKRSIEMSASQSGYITRENDETENNNDEQDNTDTQKGSVKDKNTDKTTAKETDKPQKTDTSAKQTASPTTAPSKTASYASDASVKKLLQAAIKPVGTTMYIYGGGWNNADTGANTTCTTLGVSSKWKEFYSKQDSTYNYKSHSDRSLGLDSSGYVGWVLYNTLMTENNKQGFVMKAESFDEKLAELGLGKRTPKSDVTVRRPGDIMSSQSDGFVYIVLGTCYDGSVLLVCSSPPGVRICGTPSSSGNTDSEAVILAEQIMNDKFGSWYNKFPDCSKGMSYLTNYDKFSPDTSKVIKDKEGLRNMSAVEIVNLLF